MNPAIHHLMQTHNITELQATRAKRSHPAALAHAMKTRPWIRSMSK